MIAVSSQVVYPQSILRTTSCSPFCAPLNVFYFYPDDFNLEPLLDKGPSHIPEQIALLGEQISKQDLITTDEYLDDIYEIANRYDTDAYIQYFAGMEAYNNSQYEQWAVYCLKAFSLSPHKPLYAVEAGLIAYYANDFNKALEYVSLIDADKLLSAKYKSLYFGLLSKLYSVLHQHEEEKNYSDITVSYFNKSESIEWLKGVFNNGSIKIDREIYANLLRRYNHEIN